MRGWFPFRANITPPTAASIRGRLLFHSNVMPLWLLFEGGLYLRKYGITSKKPASAILQIKKMSNLNVWIPSINCFSLLHRPTCRIENMTLTTCYGWLWKNSKSTNCYSLLHKNSTNARTALISCFWLLHRPTIKNMTLSKCYEWHCKNWRSISCYLLVCNNLMTERMSVCLWLKPLQPNHFLRFLSARFLTMKSADTFLSAFESPRTSKGMCQLIFCRPHKIKCLILIRPIHQIQCGRPYLNFYF